MDTLIRQRYCVCSLIVLSVTFLLLNCDTKGSAKQDNNIDENVATKLNTIEKIPVGLILWDPLGYGTISNQVMCGITNVHAVKDTANSSITITFDFNEKVYPLNNNRVKQLDISFNALIGLLDGNAEELARFSTAEKFLTEGVNESLYSQVAPENRNFLGKLQVLKTTNNSLTYQINKRDIIFTQMVCIGLYYQNIPSVKKLVTEEEFKNETADFRTSLGF